MKITRAQYNALLDLLRPLTARPGEGLSASATPGDFARFADKAGCHAGLAMRLLHQIPPHADKDPADMLDVFNDIDRALSGDSGVTGRRAGNPKANG